MDWPSLRKEWTCKIISSKISQCIYAIKKILHLVDKPNLLKLYYAYVFSYITYGILLWWPMTKTEALHDLEKKQLNFVKFSDVVKLELCKFVHCIFAK